MALWRRLAAQAPWPPKDSWKVLDDLQEAVGREAHRNLILDLEHQEGTWEEHLAAFRRWPDRFPGHPETEQVRSEIAAIEKTARVGTARPADPGKPPARLPETEQANALVERLSDPFAFLIETIDGDVLASRGGVAVPPREQWPLPKLIALGGAAVPRLVEALDDERFTRSVTWDGSPSKGWIRQACYVERVADLALVALGAITGEDFSEQGRIGRRAFLRGPGASIVTQGDAAAVQAKARAWWAAHGKDVGRGR